ncbi:MAG: T9SS type A sorting domain-containing protein, partial [Bacteroidetes bacterium]|nr:T9SS type A sorting domain-containing protein [Bacteroidota bacterium]
SSAAANPVVSPSANTNYFLTVDDGYNQVTGSLPITVKTIPSASGPIAGTSTVMAEDIGVSYSVPPVPGATSYEWGYTGQGVVIHGDQNSITIDFQATAISGNLRVRAINECGQGLFSADFPIQVEYVCRPHWQVAGSFPYHMNLIAKLYFDNVLSTNPYDSVAAFIDGECRGRSSRDIVDPGTLYINIGSYTVLPDTVRLKAWNSTTCEELDIYEAFPFSVTTLGDPTPVSLHTGWHETKIPLYNGWNWFSVNVNPGSMDINKLLSSVIADNTSQVKGPSQFATYNGVKWTGALKTLDPRQMYMLKVTVAQTLRLAGIPVTNIPVNLSSGWTWIGYIPQSVLAVNIALDSIYPSPAANSIIKDQAKFAKYAANKWTGALSALNPGKGYKLQLTQASTLLYPSPAKSGSGSSVPYTEPLPSNLPLSWKAVCDKEFNLTLLCKVKLDLESFSNDPDDVIAAFVGNECRGFATPDKENPGIYFLSVNSDVPSLETIRFRYLSGAKSDIAEVYQHLRYENTEDMGTLNNPVILTLASPMSIEENEMAGQNFLGENYPDPFGESTTIPFGLAKKASVSLKVFDMLGREVISLLEEEMKPGLQQVTADKQQLGRGIYYYRIEVVTDNERFVETKRMVVE